MELLINALILIVLFAIVAWGAFQICQSAKMPLPVFWVVGVALLILLIVLASKVINGGGIIFYHLR